MLKGILTVGGWTMASRILGLLREMLIAALVGTGPVAEAFIIANKVPNLFRRLFGEGAFNAAFVPSFSGLLQTEGHDAAQRFASEAMAVMTFWLVSLTILGEICMPWMMTVLANGFVDDPSKFALTVTLSRITFPYLPLICLCALVGGVLNGLNRFTAASASYVLFNVVSIVFMLWATPFMPGVGHALAWGVTVSGVLQLSLMLWAAKRAGMALHLPRPRLTPRMRILLRRMGPGLIGAGVTQINFLIDVVITTLLPAGSVALLGYADRVNQLPLGVVGLATSTASLPVLSRLVHAGDEQGANHAMNRALEYAMTLILPAAVALIVIAQPIMAVLYERGAFTAEATYLSSQSLAAYAIGLPAFVAVRIITNGFFARGDTATPVKISIFIIALNLGLNLLLMNRLHHMGPPLASSIAAYVNVLVLSAMLGRRGHFSADAALRRALSRMGLAALAMGAVLAVFRPLLFDTLPDIHGARWVALALLMAIGGGAYVLSGQMLGAFRIRDTLAKIRRRR
ncbi:murein biosynthesis integral membrane protein MurJ [Granulibacter bethesdensis]|uniref:Probable lipid II flippase MurJ n=1 Tax=Granulibacter bethesdensis (strain ATCC BAA-1260 / CGDNIH1) TaxID=391165 RepID=Q0BPE5_GRABC|nr:murein biosynthesis integral membrane protein MurJ [Granulibacter bethesdensis]ABI63307.1 Virulence factor mviN [Granulibacter bethesdensis CGDNIH1]APH53191.1 Virulence factor mviN [Granulibacter bethesdensis]APH65880.1 Virulence factor mviN [Granulibacter bethesdensis]